MDGQAAPLGGSAPVGLSREGIVQAALAVVDADGAEALTMRRLAAELGTGPMSLYRYFASKEELLDAVVQAVMAEVDVARGAPASWQQRLGAVVRGFRAVADRHPEVVRLIPDHPPRDPAALRFVEAALDGLRRAGFPPASAAHAYRLIASYAFGQVRLDLAGFFHHDGAALEVTDPRLGDLADYFPRLAEAGHHLGAYDPGEELAVGLGYIVAGLRAELERSELTTLQAQLAAIVQSSDDAIIGKTTAGVITSWNPGAERLYGHRADEVVGRTIGVIIPPHRRSEQQEILDRIARGERIDHRRTERACKDGRTIWVSLTVSPILGPDGAILGASAIARPIDPPLESPTAPGVPPA